MGFDIPNPYRGNYKLLVILPLLLIAISLFYIPQIKKGVDFKGGVLVTLHTNESIDSADLAKKLRADGETVVSATTAPSAAGGYTTELELERREALERADTLKTDFFNQITDVSRLELDAIYSNTSDTKAAYLQSRAKMDRIADELLALSGNSTKASSLATTDDMKAAVVSAWKAVSDREKDALRASIDKNVNYNSASFNEVSSSLSSKFLDKAVMVVIWSTIFTIIAVFLIFRDFVPSIAVLTGALSDVLIAMGAMGLFGIPLSLASFAALLMLIGFSLDTDVLLTKRVISRKEGHASDRAYEAMKTGMTMSAAAIVAFLSLFILAYFTNIRIYYEISSVALAGLFGDIFATWGINAVMILHHAEEMEKKGGMGGSQKPLASFIFRN